MFSYPRIRVVAFIVAGIGLLDSLYLSWSKITQQNVFCGTSGQCETVNNSPYSEIGGVPIAFLGVGAYLVILALLYLDGKGGFWRENSWLMIFGISLIGFLYSVYLTYIEIAVLYAICVYCVVSAIAITIIFLISVFRLKIAQSTAYSGYN
jgi:uncharacterized membrane protein